jgi:hypothetical protein
MMEYNFAVISLLFRCYFAVISLLFLLMLGCYFSAAVATTPGFLRRRPVCWLFLRCIYQRDQQAWVRSQAKG